MPETEVPHHAGQVVDVVDTARDRDPTETAERALLDLLTEVTGADDVGTDSNFFEDLCVDSMVLARFCARIRKRPDLPTVSMKDVYAHPSVGELTAALPVAQPTESTVADRTVPVVAEPTPPGSTVAYLTCGMFQLAYFIGYLVLVGLLSTLSYRWIDESVDLLGYYLRSVAVGAIAFAGLCLLPIVAKWLLIGRFTTRPVRIWSMGYVRFWVVKTLIRTNPLLLFAVGSPLLPLYLRALGARIGPRVTYLSRSVPICTDLLTIGADTVVRKDAFLNGYRARAGRIEPGRVTIGRGAFVGEAAVLDPGTTLGDGAGIGHASSLHTGQSIPDGESWHGTPARPCTASYRMEASVSCGLRRRVLHSVMKIVMLLVLYLPLLLGGVDVLVSAFPQLSDGVDAAQARLGTAGPVLGALAASAALVAGVVLAGLVLGVVVPRVTAALIVPDREYPLYGARYSLQRVTARLTTLKFFMMLFGDSSYAVGYLRSIGYGLRRVAQTGSNFGNEVRHELPTLTAVGGGTMVADGLSVANADFSSGSFRVSQVRIGRRSFLGNRIVYTAQSRVGENCLLATKVLVPVDGPVRENVGLLGSPPFEIPRSVYRDAGFDHVTEGVELHRHLAAKNRYNLRTILLVLFVRWMHVFGLLLISMAVAAEFDRFGVFAVAGGLLGDLMFTLAYFVLVERLANGFRRLRPRFCSIYDPYFWWHERYWKLIVPQWQRALDGTPFKNLLSRALGMRTGRRLFDDGCSMIEKTLVAVGDDCILNAGSQIQCHSQEDGTFKSDRSRLGDRVTLGVSAFVHYGTTVDDDAVLEPDSFLMKGEQVPRGQVWAGNPAQETRRPV